MSRKCPFCKTEINEGATVCAGCGAYESTPAREGGAGTKLLLLITVPCGLFVALATAASMGLMGMIISVFFTYMAYKFVSIISGQTKTSWYRKH